MLDADITGRPCGRKAQFASKGYFAKQRNRRGRQEAYRIGTWYEEIVVERIYDGKTQLNRALRPLIEAGGLEIQLQALPPVRLLSQLTQAYQPIAARQGVELVFETPSDLTVEIFADENRKMQVLRNLLDNALRYTPQGGAVRLGVETGEKVSLYVKDSGAGIAAGGLPFVFDRFYRADKSRGSNSGMGLGLAICKALVTAQGGAIHAESAGPGQGTTMWLSFEPKKP